MSLESALAPQRKTKKSSNQRRTFVPRLEVLERRDLLSTFAVINTSGDPNTTGSLPWAVQQSNSTPGANTITFAIGSGGAQTISLSNSLFLNNQVTIDGTSQPGFTGTPLISVQGSASVPSIFVLGSGSSGSVIQGLDMFDYAGGNAVTITQTSTGNAIQNNWMGFFVDPTNGQHILNNALGPQFGNSSGLGIQSSNNAIRGNVIDGSFNAIRMGEDPAAPWSGTVYSGNSFTGNFIGTDPSGATSAGWGNTQSGIFFGSGCQHNFIGPNNVISGNAIHGIELFAPSDTANTIYGNKIGTDVTGNHAIPNGDGITITDGSGGNTIGGNLGGNLISGNKSLGISLGLAGFGVSNNNFVQFNIVGLNAGQTAALGNGTYGIAITASSAGNVVQGNVVAAATGSGIILAFTTHDTIQGNFIGINGHGVGFPNGNLGVELGQGATNITVVNNSMGPQGFAPLFINGADTGIVFSNTFTNNTAKTQQLSSDFATLFSAIGAGNISLAFAELGDLIGILISLLFSSI